MNSHTTVEHPMPAPDSSGTRLFSKLRIRLLLLLLLILLPALVLSLYTASEQGQFASRSAQQEALRLAQLSASNQEQLVRSSEQLLITLAQLEEVRSGNTAECNALFADLREQYSSYTNLYMVDADGDTICSGLPTPPGFNVAHVEWFQRAMQITGFSAGDYDLGALTRRPVITFSYPVLDEAGSILYQIGASIDLEWVGEFVASSDLPPETTVTAIDSSGTIFYRYPEPERWLGQQWRSTDLLRNAVAAGANTFEAKELDNRDFLYGFVPLATANNNTYVVVGVAEDIAFAESNRLLRQNLLWLSMIGLTTAVIAWYGTERFIVRPVQVMVAGTRRLADGDLTARIDTRAAESTDELRELASAFNDMAVSLEQRQRELSDSKAALQEARDDLEIRVQDRTEKLAFLAEASSLLGSTLDYEETLSALSRLVVPRVADWCIIRMLDPNGKLQHIDIRHTDPEKTEWGRALNARYAVNWNDPQGPYNIVQTGTSQLIPVVTDDILVAAAHNQEHLALIRQVGVKSQMNVPLKVRDQIVGTFTFLSAESGRHFDESDLSLAEEIARRASLAIDNAMLFREAQAQRERLQVTLASIGDAVIASDTTGTITFMNSMAEILTGWTQDESIGKPIDSIFRIISESTREPIESPAGKAIREGSVIALSNHTLLIRRDSSEIAVDDSAAPIRDLHGEVAGAVLVFRDVSQRKQAEMALVQERNLLRTLIDNIPDFVYVKDVSGRFLMVNSAVGTFLTDALPVDQTIGKSDFDFFPAEMAQRYFDDEQAIIRTGQPLLAREEPSLKRDGSQITVLTTKVPLHTGTGELVGILGITRDISQQKRTQAQLQQRYAQLEAIYDLTTAVNQAEALAQIYTTAINSLVQHLGSDRASVLLFDPDGVLRFKAWHGISDGYRQQTEGHTPWSPDTENPEPILIPSVEADMTLGALQAIILGEGIRALGFFPLVYAGGLLGKFMIYYNAPHDFNDEEMQFTQTVASHVAFAIGRNMAEQARADLLRREQESRAQAEKADALKLQFLAMISHELRTPLTSIKGYTSTLLADDVVWDAETQREFIGIADLEADKLKDLVEQLLDVSRLQAGTLRITPERRTFASIVQVAMAQLHTVTIHHRFSVSLPPDLPPVMADDQRIAQVLVNLVNNAVKYSPPDTQITVDVKPIDGFIQVDVCDEGEGIPPEDREFVFEAFRQAERKGKQRGAGLGLAICKGLVEAHGGAIWIQALPPPGTTVSFTLPISE